MNKNKEIPKHKTLRAPSWLTILAIIANGLLFGVGLFVFIICIYILFIVDPSKTSPDSMNRNSSLVEKLSALLFIIVVMIIGYFINRYIYRRMIIKYGSPDT